MSPPLGQGALSDDARLTSVWRVSVWHLSVCHVHDLSREQRGLAGTAFLVILSLLINGSSSEISSKFIFS